MALLPRPSGSVYAADGPQLHRARITQIWSAFFFSFFSFFFFRGNKPSHVCRASASSVKCKMLSVGTQIPLLYSRCWQGDILSSWLISWSRRRRKKQKRNNPSSCSGVIIEMSLSGSRCFLTSQPNISVITCTVRARRVIQEHTKQHMSLCAPLCLSKAPSPAAALWKLFVLQRHPVGENQCCADAQR